MHNLIFLEASKSGRFENRFLEKIEVFICLSEKEVAALGFLNTDSKMDYHGFHASDELSFNWAKALYSYYGIRQLEEKSTSYSQVSETNNSFPDIVFMKKSRGASHFVNLEPSAGFGPATITLPR